MYATSEIMRSIEMATSHNSVAKATAGLLGFDASVPISAKAAAEFRQSGFAFCLRYLSRSTPQASGDLTSGELNGLLDGGLAVMAVQHVTGEGWVPTGDLGTQYGNSAAANASQAGLPPGVTLWLDLEGIQSGVNRADVISYCNNWFGIVLSAGYEPGIYVGANCGLEGDDLYWQLTTRHYWRSGSDVPDLPHRGYQLVQRITQSPDIVNGIDIDRDVTYFDEFGDSVTWLTS
jgi:hypothetical protein